MSLLVDKELKALIEPPIPARVGWNPLVSATLPAIGIWDSKIQPSSLDLTIGRILLPIEDDDENGALTAESSVSLNQGETAVVETAEYLSLPRTVAAIGFPPASVSREGLLTTNPGHIDPGFSGRLKFTVINLGKKPIELASGKLICTLLFFSINAPDYAYDQLDKSQKPEAPSERSLLRKLSSDFLNFNGRIKDQVKVELQSLDWQLKALQFIAPFLSAVVAAGVTYWLTTTNDLASLRIKMEGIEKTQSIQELKSRIEKLENQLGASRKP